MYLYYHILNHLSIDILNIFLPMIMQANEKHKDMQVPKK